MAARNLGPPERLTEQGFTGAQGLPEKGQLSLSHECKEKGPGNRRGLRLLKGNGLVEKLTRYRYQRLAIRLRVAGL